MIVYRELSSLTQDLGVSARTLYALSNRRSLHYRPVKIPKGNGEFRELWVPDAQLKAVQKRIAEKLLALEPVSPYAMAYRPGGSTLRNAAPHVGRPVLLKLDIRQFFDHCIYPLVKEKAFPAERYSEANRVLLALLCVHKDALPQGAPTSPAISNLILREFDDTVGAWCRSRGIVYTRYCDDMTFSGDFDPQPVKALVQRELRNLGLFLHSGKTLVLRGGKRKCVTGLVVNERLSVPSSYRRKLRQELYYCNRYGAEEHLRRIGSGEQPAHYLRSLLGRVDYVLSVLPEETELRQSRRALLQQLQREEAKL